jgi:hypothetical protein
MDVPGLVALKGRIQSKKDIPNDDDQYQCDHQGYDESEENMGVSDSYVVMLIADFIHMITTYPGIRHRRTARKWKNRSGSQVICLDVRAPSHDALPRSGKPISP